MAQTVAWLVDVAMRANDSSKLSSVRGAPRLSSDSDHATLIAWLTWNDRNGDYLPAGHPDAYTVEECWKEINGAIS